MDQATFLYLLLLWMIVQRVAVPHQPRRCSSSAGANAPMKKARLGGPFSEVIGQTNGPLSACIMA